MTGMHGPQAAADTLRREFGAFVLERYPFACVAAREALAATGGQPRRDEAAIDALREPVCARVPRAACSRLRAHRSRRPHPGRHRRRSASSRRSRRSSTPATDSCAGPRSAPR